MKDSKRIDNKAKSRRIAAYALAGCMAITAAPINLPNMGAEVVEAATVYQNITKLKAGTYNLTVENKVKSSTTFAEVANQLNVVATATAANVDGTYNKATWAKGAKSVEIWNSDQTEMIWNTAGDTPVSGTTKIGYGKTYVIKANFDRTVALDTGVEEANVNVVGRTDSNVTTNTPAVDKKSTNVIVENIAFYPTSGMLKNEFETSTTDYYYVDKDGDLDTTKTGVYKNEEGWFLAVSGVAHTVGVTPTVERNSNGSWYIGSNGQVDFTKTGIVLAPDAGRGKTNTGLATGYYYVEKGKVNYNKTGLVQQDGKWYNVVKGKVETANKTTVVKAPNGKWVYIDRAGISDSGFTGLAENSNGTWYIKNGIVDFTKEGPVEINDSTGAEESWGNGDTRYFVIGGKVQTNTTGVLFYKNTPYYVEKGVIGQADFDERILAKDVQTGKWYSLDKEGNRDGFDGLVKNQYGTWWVVNGEVDFDVNGVVSVDEDNAMAGGDDVVASYYVQGGKVQKGTNGLVLLKYSWGNKAINVKDGKLIGLDINNAVVKATDGKWYSINEDGFTAGYTDNSGFDHGELAGNKNGIWMSNTSGIVDFKVTGLHIVTEKEAKLSGISEGDVVYIKDGKLQNDVTGLVTIERNDLSRSDITDIAIGDTIYVKNGVVCDTISLKEPTVMKDNDGVWRYVDENGVDPDFEGIAKNSYGTWYVKNGIVDFRATGFYTKDDKTYYFVDNKLAEDKTGVVKDVIIGSNTDVLRYVEKGVVTAKKTNDNVVKFADGVWYYIKDDGTIDNTFTGVAQNKNGVWFVENGRVDFTKNGIITIDDSTVKMDSDKISNLDNPYTLYVVNGKVQLDYTGFVIDKTQKVYFEKGQAVQNEEPQVVKGTDGKWYYIVNGSVDTNYTGLAKNKNGVWYVYNGVVSFSKTGLVPTQAVDSAKLDAGTYYVTNGKMTSDKNGIVKDGNDSYYVQKSAVVTGIKAGENVIKVDGTWYCINDTGMVYTPVDNLAENNNGIWYIKDGKVDFTKSALVEVDSYNEAPTVTKKSLGGKKVYISGGMFQEEATVVFADKDTAPTYVKKGVVTTNDDTITENKVVKGTDGKYYAVQPDTAANAIVVDGIAKNDDKEIVLVKDKVVDTKTTTIYTVQAGHDESLTGLNASDDMLFVNGKWAKETTDAVRVNVGGVMKTVCVIKGVCTAPTGGDDLVKVGTTYYMVDTATAGVNGTSHYYVKTNSGATIGTYNTNDHYYVVNGKVSEVDRTNFSDPNTGLLWNIKNGKATLVAADTGKKIIATFPDGKYVINDTGAKVADGTNNQVVTVAESTGNVDYAIDKDGKVITGTGNQRVNLAADAVVVDKYGRVILASASANTYVALSDGKACVIPRSSAGNKIAVATVTAVYNISSGVDYIVGNDGYVIKASAGKYKAVYEDDNDDATYIVGSDGKVVYAGATDKHIVAEDGKYYIIGASDKDIKASVSGLVLFSKSSTDKVVAKFTSGVCDTTAANSVHKVTSAEASATGLTEDDIIVLKKNVFDSQASGYVKVDDSVTDNNAIVTLTESNAAIFGYTNHSNGTYKYAVSNGKVDFSDDMTE